MQKFLIFLLSVCLIVTACSSDSSQNHELTEALNKIQELESQFESFKDQATTTPSTTTTTTTTTTTLNAATTVTEEDPPLTTEVDEQALLEEAFLEEELMEEAILSSEYSWGQSEEAKDLQAVLGLEADGYYGNRTREAHITELESRELSIENVPSEPPPPPTTEPPWILTSCTLEAYDERYWGEVAFYADDVDVHLTLHFSETPPEGTTAFGTWIVETRGTNEDGTPREDLQPQINDGSWNIVDTDDHVIRTVFLGTHSGVKSVIATLQVTEIYPSGIRAFPPMTSSVSCSHPPRLMQPGQP